VADLGTLALGTFTNVATTAITGAEPVLQVIASADDAKHVHDTANTTHTGVASFALGETPGDLDNVDTVSIRLRYGLSGAPDNNVWDSLTAQIVESDGSTPLTDEVTVVTGAIEDTSPTNSSVVALTNPNTGASKETWDAALVLIRFNISKNKGGDAVEERVFAAEVTGEYSVASQNVTVSPAAGSFVYAGAALSIAETVTVPAGSLAYVGGALTLAESLTVAAGSLALTGQALTVQTTEHVTRSPAPGSVTYAGSGLTLRLDVGIDAGQVVWTGVAPTIEISAPTTAGPGAGSLVLTGQQPTIALTEHVTVSPASGSLAYTGSGLTLRLAVGVESDRLVWTGAAPTVAISAPQTVKPASGSLVLAAQALTVDDSQTLSLDAGTLALIGQLPTVEMTDSGQVAAIPAGSVAFVGIAPLIIAPLTIGIGPGALRLTGGAVNQEDGDEDDYWDRVSHVVRRRRVFG